VKNGWPWQGLRENEVGVPNNGTAYRGWNGSIPPIATREYSCLNDGL